MIGETPMTVVPFKSPARLPTGELDENRMIDWTVALWERTDPGVEDREYLQADLIAGLREGELAPAVYATRLAANGSKLCYAALDTVARELQTLLLHGQRLTKLGHQKVISFFQQHPKLIRPEGRPKFEFDELVRDVRICLCIDAVCREFGVPATRNREARRAARRVERYGERRDPSAISIVRAAVRRLIPLLATEESIRRHIWHGYVGHRLRACGIISS